MVTNSFKFFPVGTGEDFRDLLQAIVASPPIQSDAAEMCTQSAISVFQDEPASTASCPETDNPPTKTSAITNAGTSGSTRSSSHARKTSARTSANASVMTMNARPNRVCAIGERSP